VHTCGDTLKTQEELQSIAQARKSTLEQAINKQRAEGRQRTKTETTEGRPVHNAKAVPTFYRPSWDLEEEPEHDNQPSIQQARDQLVQVASNLLVQRRLTTRISALRTSLATFGSKEEILHAIHSQKHADADEDSQAKSMDFAGVPDEPALPQFPEEELAAPDPVLTHDICSFDDTATVPLEVPKHYQLMGYETLKLPSTPAFITIETSRLLLSGAEEEDLLRGARAVSVRPAASSAATGPPGAKFSHEPTVFDPPKQEPAHQVPEHCKEALPSNPVELLKPPVRVRACSQLLRYPEVDCDRVLGPIAPALGATSLQEACGSNTVLGLWNVSTMKAVIDSTRSQRTRSWFDDSVPKLLTGPPEGVNVHQVVPAMSSAADMVPPEEIPHPYQEGVSMLANKTRSQRETWSGRLVARIRHVNDMIQHPGLKLTYK